MNNTINVLIVEDEPLIIDLLKNMFDHISNTGHDLEFKLQTAQDCDSAFQKIEQAISGTPFDLAMLDVNMPPSKDKNILSGEDLGIALRKYFPEIKIMVYTACSDNYRLNNILSTINPEGFLVKSDVGYENLIEAIRRVLTRPPYYSESILSLIRQHISNDFVLDSVDRLLLYEISKGTRTKDLPGLVNLSKGGVERRKRHLKEVFNIEDKGDKELIQMAKDKGYI